MAFRVEFKPSRAALHRKRLRRRRIITRVLILLFAVAVAGLVGKPVLNAIRGWQARRYSARAFASMDEQKFFKAREEVIAAYRLRPQEPQAIRAVARLLSLAEQVDALDFWKTLASHTRLTRADLRSEAGIALKVDDLARADEATEQLLETRDGKPTPADLLLAAEVCFRKRQFDKATEFTRKALADPAATRRDQLQATMTLDTIMQNSAAKSADYSEEIERRLVELAKDRDDVALDALITLARRVLAAPGDQKNFSFMPVEQIIQAINNHPLATPANRLLAVDLEMSRHKDRQEEIERQTVQRWKNASNEEMTALAAWLYHRGEYQRELDAISLDRATRTRELFIEHVEALAALNRWEDIRQILESERFPLDPVTQSMYLARCYAREGQQQGAENNWQHALESAAGNLSSLLTLGGYAEKSDAYRVALAAYDAAAAASPKSRVAEQGRLRVAYAIRDTKRIHALLEELLKIWPKDTAVQNEEAYVRLLLWPNESTLEKRTSGSGQRLTPEELNRIETLAENLVKQDPTSIPHHTLLALLRLRQNRPADALAVYANFAVPSGPFTPASVAVHAATLAANGRLDQARAEIAKIPGNSLLPEERDLIQGVKSD